LRGCLLEAFAGSKPGDGPSKAKENGAAGHISYEMVLNASREYIPLIHQILLTCKVQPEVARLDERLVFEWASGIEATKTKQKFKSEALMYELTMTLACEGLGTAGTACDESVAGDFSTASKYFKSAAGVFEYLAEDLLPKWHARGSSVDAADLPSESTVGVSDALKSLFLSSAQQMAVATVLVKPGVPNYGLLSKLTLGIAEQMEASVSTFRKRAKVHMERVDKNFFTLMTFQICLQRSLSSYFLARSLWDKCEYGLAVAFLFHAKESLRERDSPTAPGIPVIDSKSPLKPLGPDYAALMKHMTELLDSWESDNSTIYFEKVPNPIPENRKLAKGLHMMKPLTYELGDVDPLPLSIPSNDMPPLSSAPPSYSEAQQQIVRSDEDFARELQEKLNRE